MNPRIQGVVFLLKCYLVPRIKCVGKENFVWRPLCARSPKPVSRDNRINLSKFIGPTTCHDCRMGVRDPRLGAMNVSPYLSVSKPFIEVWRLIGQEI